VIAVGHVVVAQPSVVDQVVPGAGDVHATHTVLAAFGWVRPVHLLLVHEPAVVQMLLEAIAGHDVHDNLFAAGYVPFVH
jgi:hypothetical protein